MLLSSTMNSSLRVGTGRKSWLVAYASIQDADLLKENEANNTLLQM